ncbi:MAG: hypothetical protein ABIN57_05905 [Chitinophagaceae bacterium]
MKKRTHQLLNFFAFNLLFFALYLNFIHKDNNSSETFAEKHSSAYTASLVEKAATENHKILSAPAVMVAPKAP